MSRSNSHRVVVDTNVILSGFINAEGAPRRIVSQWRNDLFRPLITLAVVVEYRDVLSRPKSARKYVLASPDEYLDVLFRNAEPVTPIPLDLLPVTVRDERDRHLLAAALGGGATHIVTGDQDLLTLDGHPALGTLRILTARDFLDLLPATS